MRSSAVSKSIATVRENIQRTDKGTRSFRKRVVAKEQIGLTGTSFYYCKIIDWK
jgi:hypothetical protein